MAYAQLCSVDLLAAHVGGLHLDGWDVLWIAGEGVAREHGQVG